MEILMRQIYNIRHDMTRFAFHLFHFKYLIISSCFSCTSRNFTLKNKNTLRIFDPYILPNHKNTLPSVLIKKCVFIYKFCLSTKKLFFSVQTCPMIHFGEDVWICMTVFSSINAIFSIAGLFVFAYGAFKASKDVSDNQHSR